jgi:putative flippase GtrA
VLFALISGLGTTAHYLVLLGTVWLHTGGAWWGSVAGATVGLVVNYHLHVRITFVGSPRGARAFARFVAASSLGFMMNAALMALGLWWSWHWLAAQLFATAGSLVSNYLLAKLWVFAPPTTAKEWE